MIGSPVEISVCDPLNSDVISMGSTLGSDAYDVTVKLTSSFVLCKLTTVKLQEPGCRKKVEVNIDRNKLNIDFSI